MKVETNKGVYYNYGPPPKLLQNSKMILLTEGGTGILGQWNNCVGVIGWFPMPDRNKEEEKRRGII